MSSTIKILAIAGSLRKNSYNHGLLKLAKENAPSNCKIEIFELKDIPIYCQDNEVPVPEIVNQFKKKIEEADAILVATPEYNHSISGVLKNAIDWGSRPWGNNSWKDKRVGIMGASTSDRGTSAAQSHLRQILSALRVQILNTPEVMITATEKNFDAKGNVIDLKTKESVVKLIDALSAFSTK